MEVNVMTEKITSINSEMLIWARMESGLSLDELPKKMRDRVDGWEKGMDHPTYKQLKDLGRYYKKPIAIFFFPEPPAMRDLSASFRTISPHNTTTSYHLLIPLINEARVFQINLEELHNGENLAYSNFSAIDFGTDIATMVAHVRNVFNVNVTEQKNIKRNDDHFEFWREQFSQIGIYVFKSPFKNNEISGFCLYDETFPVIYINNSLSFTRQTFTLFHELCHIMCKTSGIDVIDEDLSNSSFSPEGLHIEMMCNAFAGAFLVPDDDFREQVYQKEPTTKFVEELSKSYGVSREVILRKFLDHNIITRREYQERSAEYTTDYVRRQRKTGEKTSGGDYYNTQASYKGKRYIELVFQKYYSNQISLNQTAQYMGMKIPSIREFAERRGWGTL